VKKILVSRSIYVVNGRQYEADQATAFLPEQLKPKQTHTIRFALAVFKRKLYKFSNATTSSWV
jgi:hypothetical protein